MNQSISLREEDILTVIIPYCTLPQSQASICLSSPKTPYKCIAVHEKVSIVMQVQLMLFGFKQKHASRNLKLIS